jgi:hypothetical protein
MMCQRETENPKFCSKRCAALYNVPRRKPIVRSPRTCKWCRRQYLRSEGTATLCSICKDKRQNELEELRQRTLQWYVKKYGKRTSIMFHEVRNFCRSWNKHLLGPCQGCGYDKHVEMCHVKPLASFDLDATLAIVNDEKNVVVLCPNCHWELDHGMRTSSSLTTRTGSVFQAHSG